MTTNKERVSQLFGIEVARVLDDENLIRPDDPTASDRFDSLVAAAHGEPTHWVLSAWSGPCTPTHTNIPHNLMRALANDFSALFYAPNYYTAKKDGKAVKIYQMKGAAVRNAKACKAAGLEYHLAGCVLTEVENVRV